MDFGKLADISGVDFSLPADRSLFLGKPNTSKPEIYVGPPIWSNKAWLGRIYPHNAKDSEFLYHYGQQFNTIELNVTHYQIPSDETIERWKNQVGNEFRFCPKFPQVISHERQLIGTTELTNQFVGQVLKLDNKLGVSFLQLPPYFAYNRLSVLLNYLKTLPEDLELAVEFRHPSWFDNVNNWENTVHSLAEVGVSTVITDVSGRRDVLHMSLSSDTLVLRFIANNLDKSDYSRTDEWVERLKNWQANGLKKAYLFMHTEENTLAPELSNYWVGQLNEKLRLTIKPATIQPEVVQGSLF
jgi:uncharacterized protein YecE (DUF72 family)